MLAVTVPIPLLSALAGMVLIALMSLRFRARRRYELRLRLLEMLALATSRRLPLPELLGRAASESRGVDRRCIRQIQRTLLDGEPLSDALERQGSRRFPPHVVAAVRAGEQSGRIGPILANLARNETGSVAVRHRAELTLAYPAVLAAALLFYGGVARNASGYWSEYAVLGMEAHLDGALFVAGRLAGPIMGVLILAAIAFHAFVLRPFGLYPGAMLLGWARLLRSAAPLAATGLSLGDTLRHSADASGHRALARAAEQAADRLDQGAPPSLVWAELPAPVFVRERAAAGSRRSSMSYSDLLEDLGLECARRYGERVRRWLGWVGPVSILAIAVAVLVQFGVLMHGFNLVREAIWAPW
jgi:type II secretory pathway component PulF